MKLELGVVIGDEAQEYAFFRRRISVGRGPFNDIVLSAEDAPMVCGVFSAEAPNPPSFATAPGSVAARHLREGECIGEAGDGGEVEWELEEGDRLEFEAIGLAITVVRIETEALSPWSSVGFDALDAGRLTLEAGRWIALMAQSVAKSGDLDALLAGVASLVQAHTERLPTHLELSVPVEFEPWRSLQYGLRKLREDKSAAVIGEYHEDRRALPPMAAHAPESLGALRGLDQAVFDHPEEDETTVYLPVEVDDALGAVLELSFGERLDADQVKAIADACMLAGAQLSQRVRTLELERECDNLADENRYFRELQRRHYLFKDLITESAAMRAVYDRVHAWVDTTEPVLLLGEAGTGKSLIARALHHLGERQDGMLTSLNCGAIAGELLDVALFGEVASDLVGRVEARKGIFELADRGTVFLEEVDRLSLLLQGKVLRMLREQEVRRLGEAVARQIDTRIIVSSHRDLSALVEAGRFRRDLWLALKGQRLEVPALRERREDILPLARTFLAHYARRYGRRCTGLDEAVEQRFLEHPWHGNVRELQTVIESAVLNSEDAASLSLASFQI